MAGIVKLKKMKNNPIIVANAVGATTAIVFVVCRIGVGLFPDLSFTLAQSWFHGIELTKPGSWNLTLESFVLGLISATAGAWLVGYLFSSLYNFSLEKRQRKDGDMRIAKK